MDISQALVDTAKEERLSAEQIAVDAKAAFGTACKWLDGTNTPGGDRLLRLMRKYPSFAKRLGFDPIRSEAA